MQPIGCAIVGDMGRSLLVLGGSAFVGRAVVSEASARGWEVTTLNRGTSGYAHPEVTALHGDRLDETSLRPVRDREWDLVVDTCALRSLHGTRHG
jgi:2'-hydroxyisoflavone reductase